MSGRLGRSEALELLGTRGGELAELLARASRERGSHRGDDVLPCAIVAARCGGCSSDCAFCAQSSRSTAAIERFGLLPPERLVAAARDAAHRGALRIGLVTSGRAVRPGPELEALAEAVRTISAELPIDPCASLGLLREAELGLLRERGLTRYHHNLEPAASVYPAVCTTRPWRESVRTVEAARAVGLEVCCGGIFGLGESLEQRLELLEAISGLEACSVPLNFLHPIPGTPLEGLRELTPLDCVRLVAVARLMMPDREIRVCGGREWNLRELGSWVLLAGADGLMVGDYLTTRGRGWDDDFRMIEDAGLRVPPHPRRRAARP